ncbi:hypothetical protein [Pseudooctadecabacter sp.]|uniref:hypothetical protein n=1 Tax=Pseudooctadecabacter sp. TaxID=1966338 RepID=UPI0025D42411|nr:hypothetical protein [Pseudooctadecabacter sp.]
MKIVFGLAALALTVSACAPTGNNTVFLDNGNDVSFLRQGASACPNIGTQVGTQYPLRCGPQQQIIPR